MRYRNLIRHVTAALIAASFSSHAFAFNEFFLASGPMGHLKKSDIVIARAEIVKALDTGKDGQTFSWANAETKASGTIKPTKSFTKDGMRCRTADFTTSAGGKRGASTWNLCSTKDGWKIAQ